MVRYPSVRYHRYRIWFVRWIIEGYSVRQLSQLSGLSPATLRRIIHYWLLRAPTGDTEWSRFKYLAVDGSYIEGRHTAIVVIADPTCQRVVCGWYGLKEGSARMETFCQQLAQLGLNPISVTLDGLRSVQSMMPVVWPQVVIQRCLVHIQRQGLAWCRHQPKREDTRLLRQLFTRVVTITTSNQRNHFIADWHAWQAAYGPYISASKETGWTFGDLKRAISLLSKALPYMFTYLDDPNIPASTNWLESYFSRLKAHYRQHRGLAVHHRANYFNWYFHLCKK